MNFTLVSKSVDAYNHLEKLYENLTYIKMMQVNRFALSQDKNFCKQQDLNEGELFVRFEIEEIENELFGAQKEIAAGHGDYNFNTLEKLVAFSIPAMEQEGKEVDSFA